MAFQESSATLPIDSEFNSGVHWHREIQDQVTFYIGGVFSTGIHSATMDMDAPYNGSDGNDSYGPGEDRTPDNNRNIYISDAPALSMIDDFPIGTIIARRFSAREWISWNAAVMSDISAWHYFFTVKKTGPGIWMLAGGNEMNKFGAGEDLTLMTEAIAEGL